MMLSGCDGSGGDSPPSKTGSNGTPRSVTLTKIAITPPAATVAKGQAAHLAAIGSYSDASTADLTGQVTWASGNIGIATVKSTTGVATGIEVGSTTVTASTNGISSPTASFTVTAAAMTGITINPTAPSTPKGTPVAFTATATYSDGSSGNVTGSVTWVSANITVATLNASGVASSLTQGSTTITAVANNITSNNATLTVTAPPKGLSYQSPVTVTAGKAIGLLSPTVTGTVTNYAVTPALPVGLSLDATTGVISGAPTTAQASGNYTVTASNATGNASFVLAIAVNPASPAGLSYTSPVTVVIEHAMQSLTPRITGFVSRYSISPALPPGLNIDKSSGAIAGTPTSVSGQQTYTVTAANVTGNTTFALQLNAVPALIASAGPDRTVELGSFVSLDGSASSAFNGKPLTFHWTFTSTPNNSESALTATSSMQPIFRADKLGTYTASLTVSDHADASSPAMVKITVVPKTVRVISPPANYSIPITACREITTPGNYVLQADLVAASTSSFCLSIHDTSDVVLHCNGHHVSDAPIQNPRDYPARAIQIQNVQGFTVQHCLITTWGWEINNSSDGHVLDNEITVLPNFETGATLFNVVQTPRFTFEFNSLSNVEMQFGASNNTVLSDNRFVVTPGGPRVKGKNVGYYNGDHIEIMRNEFDGGWDGIKLYPQLSSEADDAIVLSDVSHALVQNNHIKNYWDGGVEWVGRVESSVIQGNVIVNVGFMAIGGWYWGSVSDTKFVQNLGELPAP